MKGSRYGIVVNLYYIIFKKYKLNSKKSQHQSMGSSLTIDKHVTALDDWLEIQDKLEQVQFNANPNSHIAAWRFFIDELDQSVNSTPISLDNINPLAVISSEEAYVVGLVKKADYEGGWKVQSNLSTLISSLSMSLSKNSLQTCIKYGIVDGQSVFNGKCEYFTYAYFGKRIKNTVKMSALSYSYKLSTFLSSPFRMKVITGGGVYRNKKLQIGSVLQLVKSQNNANKSLNQFKNIHLIAQLICNNPENENMDSNAGGFSLFSYPAAEKIPTFYSEQEKKISSGHSLQNRSSISNNSKPAHVHVPPIKPPMLKLALKPFEELTYEQMDEEQKNQKFDIRATARHELKMQKFGNDCSMIIEGLYLSGEKIAKDEQILKKYNITEIINCAGDYCPNWFESVRSEKNPSEFKYKYLTFFLKDSQNQNIECLFYQVIQFINKALSQGKNVLVHCIQGISRSVTFVIAYLIFTNGYDYKKAESFVKEKRGIACPNNGFMVELIQFYKRLHEKYNSLPSPRVFLVSHHCQQTPDIVTARMLKQRLFESDGKKYIGLDERGIYIIQAQEIIYVWVGSKCDDERKMKKFWAHSQSYIKKLQQYEKAPQKIKAIHQGNEGRDFLSLWGLQQLPRQYQNPDYDRLFNEQKPVPKPGYLRKHYQREQDHIEQQFISKLFIYPDHENGLGVFDLDDLAGFCILVKSDNEKIKVFVWKARDWEGSSDIEGQFLDKVIEENYASYSPEKIDIAEEGQQNQELSEQFMSCFS